MPVPAEAAMASSGGGSRAMPASGCGTRLMVMVEEGELADDRPATLPQASAGGEGWLTCNDKGERDGGEAFPARLPVVSIGPGMKPAPAPDDDPAEFATGGGNGAACLDPSSGCGQATPACSGGTGRN